MKLLIFLKTFIIVSGLVLFMIVTNGCTTFEIPAEVCIYGTMTCDAGNYICENYELPPAVCDYFNVACVNLELLCSTEYGSDQYKTALKNLYDANIALNKFVTENKPGAVQK